MADHAERIAALGLADWPHTVRTVCANEHVFSDTDRLRLANRLQAYARRHRLAIRDSTNLNDVCLDLVQHVCSVRAEPLSATEQLWFLENVADQLELDTGLRSAVQRAIQRRVQEHVVRDGWSWKQALVIVLTALAATSGIQQVPVCNEVACVAQPIASVVTQLQADAISPRQLGWSLSDDLRDYMEQRVPASVTGPVTVAEPWIQELTESMSAYYEAVRDHEAGQVSRAQRSALQTMLTDLEFAPDSINDETTISASTLRRDIRQVLADPSVDNERLLRAFARYAAWTTNMRRPSAKQITDAVLAGSARDIKIEDQKLTTGDVDVNVPKDVIVLPSFAPVTIAELNRMAGLRTFLVGMSSNEVEEYDQLVSEPYKFLAHDLQHMRDIYINAALATPNVRFDDFVNGNDDVAAKFSQYRVEYAKSADIPTPNWAELEAEQVRYRQFIDNLKETDDPTTVDQVEELFFWLWHEGPVPINSLARMTSSSEALFRRFLERGGYERFASATKLLFDHFRASPLAPSE